MEQGPKFYLLGYAKKVSGGEDVELESSTCEDLLYLCIRQLFHEKKNMHMDGGGKKTTEMRKSGFILVKTIEAKAEDHESYIYCNEK